MRLKTQDLSTHLQRGLAPLYFIVGEEPQQQLDILNKIRIKAHQEGYTQRERYDISPQFDWEGFKAELQALTLFSEKRFIEARLTGNIGKLGARVLVEIANHPTPDTLLLFSADKLDSAVSKSAWFTAIERASVTFWTRPLSKSECMVWINQRIKEMGLRLEEEAIHTLIERTEGNLLATAQAIEKLSLYSPTPTPTSTSTSTSTLQEAFNSKEVAEITGVDTHFSLFDLVDTALLGNVLRTKQIFTRLKSEGIEPILILWAITREVRTIIPLAKAMNKGVSLTEAIRQQNLWKHKLPIYTSFLKRSSLHSIHQILLQAKDLDALIKGRKIGDIWSGLFLICLHLAGVHYGTTV